ncbi:MAG: DUF1549 domain-containing protein [Fuerstiella sp.]|nr:DUF1549 domain-containing protein [Fuerstiella sp.]MCP4507279.1 DUF1549 domain-containing protein [Fuerstiella sp.]
MSTIVLLLAFLFPGDEAVHVDLNTVDFDNRVIPVLTKAGCNTGACHGAAVGRGGFRLSLYGGDPHFDFRSIVLELEGRRVNLSQPGKSLLVLKPTESIEHGGGTRLEYEGTDANLLTKWIAQGTPRIQKERLIEFRVSPDVHVAARVGAELQLKATARFTQGAVIDVTQWTVFTPEDTAAVVIDSQTAQAKLLRRGRHIVVARYLDQVVPIEIFVPVSDAVIDLADAPRHNFIDHEVLGLLSTLRIPVSQQANDLTFLRRVTLDLTGRLPTVDAIGEFVTASDRRQRTELIDRLLSSAEFSEYWTLQIARLLRIRSQPQDARGAFAYHKWLKKQISDGVPYDEFTREILTATGDTHEVGPANFYRTVGGARQQAEFTSELFMGNRLRCANCHNHPLDRWTQDDYHGLAAIFAKLESGRVIKVKRVGEVVHPRTGTAAIPRIPGEKFLDSGSDGREAFAEWLTSQDNPYFAKAIVNRLWKFMMGRGLVEPTDDLRATNPATHPALLTQLADDFVQHRYNLRHTLRRIALSAAYGRSPQMLSGNRADKRFYSHALRRPLQPEVLADAVSDITGIADQYGDATPGTRAVALFDANIKSDALDILGRCARTESCEAADQTGGGLTRKLHLFNGEFINRRNADPDSRLGKLIAAGRTPEEIVKSFYRLALSRNCTQRELAFWNEQVAAAIDSEQRQDILEDFVWSLLTCREFVTNH